MLADIREPVLEILSTPVNGGGQTQFVLRLAEAMDSRVRPDVLSFICEDDALRARIERFGHLYIAPHRLKHPLRYVRFVAKTVRGNGYRVVHCHGNSCTLALDLLGARLGGSKVRIAHSHNSDCRYHLLHRLLRPLFNHLYTCAMACGDEAGRWLFEAKPFEVIPNAVDARRFAFDPAARESLRAQLSLGDSMALGMIARFTPVKNHAFLLKAFAKAHRQRPELVLVFIGDGTLEGDAVRLAQSLGVSDAVRFLHARTDVPKLMQALDALLLPSLFEGFPTVALEGQCAGLPLVLSDRITPDCALTKSVCFIPLDESAWVEAMHLIDRAADRSRASDAGINAVAHAGYDLAAAAAKLEQTYLELAAQSK